MTLGQKLTRLRKSKDLSQKEVADRVGVHYNSYSRYELDNSRPSDKTLDRIAEIYGLDRAGLMKGVKEPKTTVRTKKTNQPKPEAAPKKAEESKTEVRIEPDFMNLPVDPAAEDTKTVTKKSAKADKKAPAKKSSAKAATKKAKPKRAEKPAVTEKEAKVPASDVEIELQYAGKAIPYSEIVDKARKEAGSNKTLKIYIKPEENRVYYVAGDDVGSFEI